MSHINDPLRNLSETLLNVGGEKDSWGVVIKRKGERDAPIYHGPVRDWLSRPDNHSGTWLIDGGWGGPPGHIHVTWNDETKAWDNEGFGGHLKA